VCAIEEVEVRGHEARSLRPVEDLVGPVRVGLVASVDGQTGGDIEETTVGDGVLVIEPGVEGEDLPSQPPVAVLVIPSASLQVENGLSKRQPLRLVLGWIWEFLLGRRHRCHCPKPLIVVTLGLGLVWRHVVGLRADLEQEALRGDLIICIVSGVVIVI